MIKANAIPLLAGAALCAIGTATASADELAGRPIALVDVIEMLVGDGIEVRRIRERLARSEAALEQARGANDWNLSLGTELARQPRPASVNGFLTDDSRRDTVLRGTLGASRQFRNGVTITPSLSVLENFDDDDDPFSESRNHLNLTVNWPLLRGAGEQAAAAGELAASSALVATRHEVDHLVARAVHRAVGEYWRTLAARAALAALARMESTATTFERRLARLVAGGELAPLTHVRARAKLAIRQLNLQRARDSLFEARHRLALAIGLDVPDEHEFRIGADELPTPPRDGGDIGVAVAIDEALGHRSDLLSIRGRIAARRTRLESARNGLLPQLDLSMSFDRVGISYSRPLDNRLAKGRLSEQKSDVREAELELAGQINRVRMQVRAAIHRIRSSKEAHARAAMTVELLERVVNDTRPRVTSGNAAPDELFSAEDELTGATLRSIEASLAYALAVSDLRVVTGSMKVGDGEDAGALADRLRDPNR